MADKEEKPQGPERFQEELQDFLKDRFGGDVFTFPFNMGAQPQDATEERPENDDTSDIVAEKLRFDLRPTQVKERLDRFVIGQEEAKRALSVAVCDHYNHVRTAQAEDSAGYDYVKQNVILLGPTGVGKTYLMRTLAQLIGVPFVKADITKFSETGYIGNDVDDLVRELVRVAGGNVELAEYGIIFLDEIDKIASASQLVGRDVSGRGVQTGLLKLLEDTDVPAHSPQDISAQFQDLMQSRQGKSAKRTISTKHILFVVSGAFSGLDEVIEKRLSERNIGFGSQADSRGDEAGPDVLSEVSTRDFIEYGFEPEFIGRLPIRVGLRDLTEDDLFHILNDSEGSILRQYQDNFRGYGIEAVFSSEALRVVAKKALAEKTGARGLMTVLESSLRDFKFYLPGTGVTKLPVTPEVIDTPDVTLKRLREAPVEAAADFSALEVRQFEEDFEKRHDLRLKLDSSAVAMAIAVAQELHISVPEYLRTTFQSHVDFLKQVREKTGRTEFPVTPQILNRPGEGVDQWLGN